MKYKILFRLLVLANVFVFSACEDEVAKPQVTLNELGLENSKIAYIGHDLHIDADIVAEAKIERITVELHSEDEAEDWELEVDFTDAQGLKNTHFHEHVDISSEFSVGDYHFHLIVVDQEGNETEVEDELELQEAVDETAPGVNVTSAPASGEAFAIGSSIVIEGEVSDEVALGGLYIGLVRDNQSIADADVNATNTITMLHTHDFDSSVAHHFSASIEVGAEDDNNAPESKAITGDIAWESGNYYVLVKCKDASGNWGFSARYPLVITMN